MIMQETPSARQPAATAFGRAVTDAEAIPLHVVTGFLGAGKTSLINRLLRARELADALVIVNEWGEVGLDHLLFEAIEGDVILMPSGCLCCSLRGDLIDCLRDLLARRDSGALAPFSRIVLETSGLSDPAPILHALMADPILARRTILAGVTTLVDAVNGQATLEAHGEARRQVALADRIALTKSDLVETPDRAARLARLQATIVDINPFAPILDAAAGEFGLEDFLSEPLDFSPRAGGADASVHASSIRAYAFAESAPLGAPALARFLEALRTMLGPRLLRVKGLAAIAEHPDQPLLIHGAQHIFHAPRRLAAWPRGERGTRIVVIVDGVDAKSIARLGEALSGRPQIDAPDLAALSENPLAPRPGGLLG
jgi:G3E family GTPase